MPFAYSELFQPAAKFDAPGFPTIANLDGNGLLFEWEVTRSRTGEADTGTISIYNLSPALSGQIQERASNTGLLSLFTVTFSIGWQQQTAELITGDLWRVVPNLRPSATDVVTQLHIGDGLQNLRDAQMGLNVTSIAFSAFLLQAITAPINAGDIGGGGLGLKIRAADRAFIKQRVTSLNLQQLNNSPAFGSTKQAIDWLMATLGLEWRVQNGFFIPMQGGINNDPAIELSPNSGLIGYAKRDDGGITLTALAIPEVQPGLRIVVRDEKGLNVDAPLYRVDTVSFTGSTQGESIMAIEAERARLV